jgi:hypothetical protein
VRVEFFDYTLHPDADLFYAVGRERGQVSRDGRTLLEVSIRTTRVFQREAGAWRQVHHHGSFDDPVQLAAYQRIFLGTSALDALLPPIPTPGPTSTPS